jgi:cytochrome c oxidase subunit 4
MADHAATHSSGEHSHTGRYALVWIALLVFTFLTYGLSRLHIPGGWGVVVALAIASAKGGLVVLFFMHLWEQSGAQRLILATSLAFVALLVGLTLLDNATRFPLANPPGSAGALPATGNLGPTYAPPPFVPGERR